VDRDSLFDSPSSHKCGFKRPRQAWSFVKDWALDDYDREVVYEKIKSILTQSLDIAGSKIFIKPNANSIAGWQPKQAHYYFLSIFLFDTNRSFLFCRTMCHANPIRHPVLFGVHLLIDEAAVSNSRFLQPKT
jgi:hypothetical protein